MVRGWRTQGPVTRNRELAFVLTVLMFVPALSHVSSTFGDLPPRHGDVLALLLALGQSLPPAVRTRRPVVCV
jgi:hypothetical protein